MSIDKLECLYYQNEMKINKFKHHKIDLLCGNIGCERERHVMLDLPVASRVTSATRLPEAIYAKHTCDVITLVLSLTWRAGD